MNYNTEKDRFQVQPLVSLDPAAHAGDLEELDRLFASMDAAYQAVADRYGFVCNGCTDNCCLSLFYHHTIAEYLWLKKGFQSLPASEQTLIKTRAEQVLAAYQQAGSGPEPVRLMCPLNRDGRCRLYRHRPMICRLHGIPHQLSGAGRPPVMGPGCDEFRQLYGSKASHRLDRTPLYRRLAALEGRLRRATALSQRLKMTVAGMITTY